MFACPLGIDIPGFIRELREHQCDDALFRIQEKNFLSSLCGRLCPAPCEKVCVLAPDAPIAVRALERYAADHGRDRRRVSRAALDKKLAVIGAGPSGMAAALEFNSWGFAVTVFDAQPVPGGLLQNALPEFRMPKKILAKEAETLRKLGIAFEPNFIFGVSAGPQELFQAGFSAILLATGRGAVDPLTIPGANLGGVYYGPEFLLRIEQARQSKEGVSHFPLGQHVAVVGCGYEALDCARTLVRLKREVVMVFACPETELSIRADEIADAKLEGVRFEPLIEVLTLTGNEQHFVSGLEARRMDFADQSGEGNWQVVPVPGSEFQIKADTVILADSLGTQRYLGKKVPGLHINADGSIWTNELIGMTSLKGVFSVPSLTKEKLSVAESIAAGKKAALRVKDYLAN